MPQRHEDRTDPTSIILLTGEKDSLHSGPGRAPCSEERKQLFIEAVKETCSLRAAAKVASPHLVGSKEPGRRLFQRLMKSDSTFRAKVNDALSEGIGRLEAELNRRAYVADTRKSFDENGNVTAQDESWKSANSLALRLLEKHSPAEYSPHKQLDSTVSVTHIPAQEHTPGLFTLTASDVDVLGEQDKADLARILAKISATRPGAIIAQPSDAIADSLGSDDEGIEAEPRQEQTS